MPYMKHFPPSELVLNPDGSIYHLHLLPDQIADTILTVGDPGRVEMISSRFDAVECRVHKREFITHTGRIGTKRLTVISTGIGPDNIDIVLNELDALANINLADRSPKPQHTVLTFIRTGTSGAIQPDLEAGSFVVSAYGIGLDNLMHFYEWRHLPHEADMQQALDAFLLHTGPLPVQPYVFAADSNLVESLRLRMPPGITLTSPGFYAPQGRTLLGKTKLKPQDIDRLSHFEHQSLRIANFEMETAAIFGLSRVLGHRAVSCNVLLANRVRHTFIEDTSAAVSRLVDEVLAWVEKA